MSQETTQQIPTPPEAEASSGRLIATLGIAGFLSGVVLVSAYLFTLPMIKANKAEDLREAIYEVLPGSTDYKAMEKQDGKLVEVDKAVESDNPRIYAGLAEDGSLTGYAIPSEEPGYQDIIAGIFGYDPEKKQIIGFVVLDSKETPGLGDKIIKDAAFQKNFEALSVEPEIITVKKGEKKNPNEVDAITGATISSKAVVRLLNKGVNDWKTAIENKD